MTRWMRFLPLWIFLAIVVVAYAMLSASSEGTRDTKAIGFSMTNAAVPDLTLPKFEGNGTIALQDYKGKAYAINIFASWCGPCKLEAASIDVMAEKLPVIGINYRDNPEDAALFLEQFGNPYADLARDDDGNYSIQLGVHGLPETFIIAPDGTILHHQQGPVFASDLNGKLGDAIKRALGS